MATERLAMQQAREILRQKLLLKRSHREVISAVGVSIGTRWVCFARLLAGVAPTRCVGESGVRRVGWASSSSMSWRYRRSY